MPGVHRLQASWMRRWYYSDSRPCQDKSVSKFIVRQRSLTSACRRQLKVVITQYFSRKNRPILMKFCAPKQTGSGTNENGMTKTEHF